MPVLRRFSVLEFPAGPVTADARGLRFGMWCIRRLGTAWRGSSGVSPSSRSWESSSPPGPLLVAVDDLQWLDQPTAEMLAFAVRRLHGPSVRFLLAERAGGSSAVERALAPAGPQILEVGPLSVGAMRRMLTDRLRRALPRYVLR